MKYPAEQHRTRAEEYTVDRDTEAVDRVLNQFFTSLGDREGLELLDTRKKAEKQNTVSRQQDPQHRPHTVQKALKTAYRFL